MNFHTTVKIFFPFVAGRAAQRHRRKTGAKVFKVKTYPKSTREFRVLLERLERAPTAAHKAKAASGFSCVRGFNYGRQNFIFTTIVVNL